MRSLPWIIVLAACKFEHGALDDGGLLGESWPIDTRIDAVSTVAQCAALPTDPNAVLVSDVTTLRTTLATALPNTTIALADGTYDVSTTGVLYITTAGITLRSASNDPTKVIIDGGLTATSLIQIGASNVTVTGITLSHARFIGVMVQAATLPITGTRIHDVTFLDDGGPAIRIFPAAADATTGPYADNGIIECSRFIVTPTSGADHCTPGQLAIDGVAIRDWTIRDNTFDGLSCSSGHRRTIWIRTGSRGTQLLRNHIKGSAMNIMLGGSSNPKRTYTDPLPANCSGTPDHWGGLVCNNTIAALSVPSITANTDFEEGIALWEACDALVIHNTIVSPAGVETYYNIEYRWSSTYVHLVNNLLKEAPGARDSGQQNGAYTSSNVTYASTADFVNAMGGDLHLATGSSQVAGTAITSLGCSSDADGKPRNLSAPMPGAYER